MNHAELHQVVKTWLAEQHPEVKFMDQIGAFDLWRVFVIADAVGALKPTQWCNVARLKVLLEPQTFEVRELWHYDTKIVTSHNITQVRLDLVTHLRSLDVGFVIHEEG